MSLSVESRRASLSNVSDAMCVYLSVEHSTTYRRHVSVLQGFIISSGVNPLRAILSAVSRMHPAAHPAPATATATTTSDQRPATMIMTNK
jgi:hypothetical protein